MKRDRGSACFSDVSFPIEIGHTPDVKVFCNEIWSRGKDTRVATIGFIVSKYVRYQADFLLVTTNVALRFCDLLAAEFYSESYLNILNENA
ncbi:Hypothetical predicted protein [Octopus vulgaris]|uniref:Uncharacterized protein n=1 Tax=Octopus vulgaris TaxID=6645 RepID=A0AA36B3Y0_OCTVU|nr:Hypothetical predicted protein [Octopus vulgaris]